MSRSLRVPGGMTIGRAIATERQSAFLAGAQMHPTRADFDALRAFLTLRMFD